MSTFLESSFVLNALKSNQRIDTRSINDFRTIKIQLFPQSSQVQIGKTRVLCHVSCDIVTPSSNHPTDGILLFNTQFSTMSGSDDTKDTQNIISRTLEKAFKRSKAIDTEGLCIVASEKVWQIKVDIRILDHQGNVIDCACLAAITALLNFRRPDVSVDGLDVVIHSVDEKNSIPLAIHHIPICVTFAFFHDGDVHVIDPNLLEETIQNSSMTVSTNIHREICTLVKPGGIAISNEKFMECVHIASIKSKLMTDLVKNAIADYNK